MAKEALQLLGVALAGGEDFGGHGGELRLDALDALERQERPDGVDLARAAVGDVEQAVARGHEVDEAAAALFEVARHHAAELALGAGRGKGREVEGVKRAGRGD